MSKFKLPTICLAVTLLMSTGGQALAAVTGGDTFKTKCAACHGADGSGSTPLGQHMKIRDLRSADVQSQTDEALTAIVTTGQKAMPAFSKSLDAEKIKGLVAFIRSIAAK
jgi:mono/diheme cytochrome c family protein